MSQKHPKDEWEKLAAVVAVSIVGQYTTFEEIVTRLHVTCPTEADVVKLLEKIISSHHVIGDIDPAYDVQEFYAAGERIKKRRQQQNRN